MNDFYNSIQNICGNWDKYNVNEAIFFISDGPMEQGYPEPWFSIPNNSKICRQAEILS